MAVLLGFGKMLTYPGRTASTCLAWLAIAVTMPPPGLSEDLCKAYTLSGCVVRVGEWRTVPVGSGYDKAVVTSSSTTAITTVFSNSTRDCEDHVMSAITCCDNTIKKTAVQCFGNCGPNGGCADYSLPGKRVATFQVEADGDDLKIIRGNGDSHACVGAVRNTARVWMVHLPLITVLGMTACAVFGLP